MKCYAEFSCDNIDVISKKIYNFLETTTNIVANKQPGWHFIDCAAVVNHVPELFDFFKANKLLPRHAAITIVNDNNSLPVHVDELPVVAKLNFPVINTQGWANCWYINNELVAEYLDMPQPIILNSQIAHSVECRSEQAQSPRIIASFTFHNEPLEYLK
jgi:hypothetical protein